MVRISLDERRRVLARTVLALTNKSTPLGATGLNSLRRCVAEMTELEEDIQFASDRKYSSAWRSWLRHGLNDGDRERGISTEERSILNAYQKRDMGTGGGNSLQGVGGAYFAPSDFVTQVEDAAKYYGPMLDVTSVAETDTGAARA